MKASCMWRFLLSLLLIVLLGLGSPGIDIAHAQPGSTAIDNAIGWAQSLVGQEAFPVVGGGTCNSYLWCARFVANAYGSANAGNNAYPLWMELDQHAGDWNAPRGSLVFFNKTASNEYGHVAISMGGGNIVQGGLKKVGTSTIAAMNSSIGAYLGWAWPPSRWPGRTSSSAPSTSVPSLNNPGDSTEHSIDVSITFSWQDISVSRYHLQLTDPNGSKTDIFSNSTSANYTPHIAGTWRWKVRYESDSGATGDWSVERSFRVNGNGSPVTPPVTPPPTNGAGGDFSIDYFNGVNFTGGVVHTDYSAGINLDWGTSVPAGVSGDAFSIRFTANKIFEDSWYHFHFEFDDAIRVYVDHVKCYEDWAVHSSTGDFDVKILPGTRQIYVEYADYGGAAKIKLYWYKVDPPVPSYTVTYDSKGGSNVQSVSVKQNNKISTCPTPTRTGYSFLGWYKNTSCTDKWDFDSSVVTSNITLYAKWSVNHYNVTFNSMNDSSSTVSVEYSALLNEPDDPEKDGYAFAGWFKESSCTNAWKFSSDRVTDDITLYAKWTYTPSVAKPDLSPTSITYDTNVAIGKQIYFDSGVVNSGGTASGFFDIEWEVNGEQLGYGGHYSVPANSTVMDGNSQFYWTPSAAGSYTIKFTVDCDSQVSESNENNNSTSVTVVIPQSTVTRANWASSYRSFLKKYFKARYFEYVGLIDIGRDGTPEMVYIEQNSSRRNPRMRIVGMVGSKAKIVSTRDYGRLLEGYSLYIRRNGSEYGCYVYGTYYSKDRKYMYENTVRITQNSSTKYGYTIVYGYRQRLSNGSEVYTVDGRSATGDEYTEVGEAFEDDWALCEPGLARIGRHTKLSYVLNYFDQEAATYTMPS